MSYRQIPLVDSTTKRFPESVMAAIRQDNAPEHGISVGPVPPAAPAINDLWVDTN